MKKFCGFIFLLLIASCSFQSKDGKEEKKIQRHSSMSPDEMRKMDSDGDKIDDFSEQERGLDRYVANLPQMKVNFLQNYIIRLRYEDESVFEVDTGIRRSNPDFKYRVGELFLKENSVDNAARIGRFSGHSWGKIKQQDFSWVQYPDIDKEFFHSKVAEFKKLSTNKLVETQISLENSLKLVQQGLYSSIEQLELNFYYYSREKESYVLLKTAEVEKTFQSGVRENFHVDISNPPKELIEDSYLRHGEFIISEVKDFFIPELGMKYSTLLKSVKAKTIPVYKVTPFESNLHYVATSGNGINFINLLERLFADKFTVQDNRLVKIEQFENNLRDFDYLHELRGVDKEGRWYVMTNKLKKHYLKHSFTPADSITLSYITGDELAKRASETIYAASEKIYSGPSSKRYILGNVSRNSSIDFSVYLKGLKGKELVAQNGAFSYRPPSCGNCTGNDWSVHANFSINSFRDFERDWNVASIDEIKDSLVVEVNGNALDMAQLIEDGLASFELNSDKNGQYLHFKLDNLHRLDVIRSGGENVASLRLFPIAEGTAARGLRLDNVGGSNIDRVYHGGKIAFQQAGKRKIPIAVTGWNFDKWKKRIPWGHKFPDGYIPTKGQMERYWDGVVVSVVSNITNYFN